MNRDITGEALAGSEMQKRYDETKDKIGPVVKFLGETVHDVAQAYAETGADWAITSAVYSGIGKVREAMKKVGNHGKVSSQEPELTLGTDSTKAGMRATPRKTHSLDDALNAAKTSEDRALIQSTYDKFDDGLSDMGAVAEELYQYATSDSDDAMRGLKQWGKIKEVAPDFSVEFDEDGTSRYDTASHTQYMNRKVHDEQTGFHEGTGHAGEYLTNPELYQDNYDADAVASACKTAKSNIAEIERRGQEILTQGKAQTVEHFGTGNPDKLVPYYQKKYGIDDPKLARQMVIDDMNTHINNLESVKTYQKSTAILADITQGEIKIKCPIAGSHSDGYYQKFGGAASRVAFSEAHANYTQLQVGYGSHSLEMLREFGGDKLCSMLEGAYQQAMSK